MKRALLSAVLPLLAAPGGCFFDFDRGVSLEPGDVSGRAFRDTDEPAAWANASVDGTGKARRADGSGEILVRDLPAGGWRLRVRDDKNGDGWPESVSDRAFAINVVTHAEGLLGQGEARRTWMLLGDLLLDGVVEVRGSVELADGSPAVGATVVAYRRTELPASTLDEATSREALEADGAIEATTATDDDGEFFFPAVGAGAVSYAAFLTDGPTELGAAPVTVDAAEGDVIAVEQLTLSLVEVPDSRAVQLELSRLPEQAIDVTLVRAGVARGLATPEQTVTFDGLAPALSVPLQVPHGLWDVYVDEGSATLGLAYKQAAVLAGDALQTWGLILLSDEDRCAGEDDEGNAIRDCDGDGWQGFPPFDDVDDPAFDTWFQCALACERSHGTDRGSEACSLAGELWDCDDDGDGQSDVTEPACYGPALGADRDWDGICDPVDPYPQCAQNDPAHPACGADRDPNAWVPPPVDPIFGGPARDGGPQPPTDAGPDGGPDDDAGVDEDGGVLADAGPVDGGDVDGGDLSDAGPVDGGQDIDAGAGSVDGGYDPGPGDAGPYFVAEVGGPGWVRAFGDSFNDVIAVEVNPDPLAYPAMVAVVEVGGTVDFGPTCQMSGSSSNPSFAIVGIGARGSCIWMSRVTPETFDGGTGSIGSLAVTWQPALGRWDAVITGTGPIRIENPDNGADFRELGPTDPMGVFSIANDGELGILRGYDHGAPSARVFDMLGLPSGETIIAGGFFGASFSWQNLSGQDTVSGQNSSTFLLTVDDLGFSTNLEVIEAVGGAGSRAEKAQLARASTGEIAVAGHFSATLFGGVTQSEGGTAELSRTGGENTFLVVYNPDWSVRFTNLVVGFSVGSDPLLDVVETQNETFWLLGGTYDNGGLIAYENDKVTEGYNFPFATGSVGSAILAYGNGSTEPASYVRFESTQGTGTAILTGMASGADGTVRHGGRFIHPAVITPSHGAGGGTIEPGGDAGTAEAWVGALAQSGFPTLPLTDVGLATVTGSTSLAFPQVTELSVLGDNTVVSTGGMLTGNSLTFGTLSMPSGRGRYLWRWDPVQ